MQFRSKVYSPKHLIAKSRTKHNQSYCASVTWYSLVLLSSAKDTCVVKEDMTREVLASSSVLTVYSVTVEYLHETGMRHPIATFPILYYWTCSTCSFFFLFRMHFFSLLGKRRRHNNWCQKLSREEMLVKKFVLSFLYLLVLERVE